MPYYIEYESDGRISRAGQCQAEVIPWLKAHTEQTIVEVAEQPADITTSYWHEGAVHTMPPRPTASHKWSYASRAWVFDDATAWAAVRQERGRRIRASDWTALADVPLSDEQRAAWQEYRQALRSITEQLDPTAISWPEPPVSGD